MPRFAVQIVRCHHSVKIVNLNFAQTAATDQMPIGIYGQGQAGGTIVLRLLRLKTGLLALIFFVVRVGQRQNARAGPVC